MTIKPADDVVTQNCKGSRASSLLSTKVLYISTIAEKDNCATKVCAYSGSLNNPFPTLDAAQAFYRTQEGSCTAANPVTYLFTDNGTYGSLVSEYTLCPFENLVAQANNANLIGKFTVDGTGALGAIGQNFTGVNFVENSTLTVKNFVKGVQYYLTLKNMLVSVDVDAPLTKDHGETGILNFEIGGGAIINLIANGLFMTNLGSADIVQIDGTDEANLGSVGIFTFDNFSASCTGGSCWSVFSSCGLERMLTTFSSSCAMVSAGDQATINISAAVSEACPPSNPPTSIVFFNGGSFQSNGSGGVVKANLGASASWTTNFSNSLIEGTHDMSMVIQSFTTGSANSTLQLSNSSISACGTALKLQHDSTGITSFVGSMVKMFHSDLEPTELPLLSVGATRGTLSWKASFCQGIANNAPGFYFFIENMSGNSEYNKKDSGHDWQQNGPLAHLFNLSLTDDSNVVKTITNCTSITHSGTIDTIKIDTTGVFSTTSNDNNSKQRNASKFPMFSKEIIRGIVKEISNGSIREALTRGAAANVHTQASGQYDSTFRNYTLSNPNGGGSSYTNLGDAVANHTALGGQVTVLNAGKSYNARENATTSYTEVQADIKALQSIVVQTEDNSTADVTLEGIRTTGAVSLAGQLISSTISTSRIKNILTMSRGKHDIFGSSVTADQNTTPLSDETAVVTAKDAAVATLRSSTASLITNGASSALQNTVSVTGSSSVSSLSTVFTNDVLGQPAIIIGGLETDPSKFVGSVLEGSSAADAPFTRINNSSASFEGNTLNIVRAAAQVLEGSNITVGSNNLVRAEQTVPATTRTSANSYPSSS